MSKDQIMATGDDAKIMLSDHGSNERLLAHELGYSNGWTREFRLTYTG
jgi:hypothetical protein